MPGFAPCARRKETPEGEEANKDAENEEISVEWRLRLGPEERARIKRIGVFGVNRV